MGPLLSLATNFGLLVGAILWSLGAMSGVESSCVPYSYSRAVFFFFSSAQRLLSPGGHTTSRCSSEVYLALQMGGSRTFVALASLAAASGVGVGGNMPVDSAVFLGSAVQRRVGLSLL
jgi:hypothetical protein